MRFIGCAAAALVGMALWASPGAALQPAPLAGAASVEATPVQFRFPWQAERKPQRRTKRSTRKTKPRTQKPAETRRAKERPPAAAPKKPADPMDAALPARLAPLGLLPLGLTIREADGWAAVAAEAPAPPTLPPLPPEGPAPAPANVLALIATMQGPAIAAPAAPAAEPGDDEAETPDIHVPLPPVRPSGPGETARDGLSAESGLAPEGRPASEGGLANEGGGLSPEGVPLPPSRPGPQMAAVEPAAPVPPEPPPDPSPPDIALPVTSHDEDPACGALADAGFAVAERLPPIEGPGACGGGPLVSLTAVKRKDGGEIKIKPAATLRCSMAKELATYLRDDLAPAAKLSGAELERLDIAGSFQCRGRNGASGGKMSEHGRANAVDLSGFGLSDGKTFGIFAADLPKNLATAAKSGACGRFSTVLGPGSDGFHESHLHVDLQPRRSKSKLCQWSEPEVARAPDKDAGDEAKDGNDEDARAAKKAEGGSESASPDDDPPPKRKASAAAKPERPKDAGK